MRGVTMKGKRKYNTILTYVLFSIAFLEGFIYGKIFNEIVVIFVVILLDIHSCLSKYFFLVNLLPHFQHIVWENQRYLKSLFYLTGVIQLKILFLWDINHKQFMLIKKDG